MIPFPLGEGEAFGRGEWAVSRAHHFEVKDVRPRLALLAWQRYIRSAWGLDVRPDGLWSGLCRDACLFVQRTAGIPPSGTLDEESWEATWKDDRMGGLSELRFLTVAEVCTALRVSDTTVHRMIRSGDLAAIKVGRAFRIYERSVNKYLERNGHQQEEQEEEPPA